MLTKARSYRPSHAVVVAYLALFVALGGGSYAAIVVTGKNVRNNTLTGRDLRNGSVTGADVKNRSLLSADFKAGQLPVGPPGSQGPPGVQGPAGVQGPKGDTGTVDTSNFYSKSQSDGRFLAIAGKAADSDRLDGSDATAFLRNERSAAGAAEGVAAFTVLSIEGSGALRGSCATPAQPSVSWLNTSGGDARLYVDDGSASATTTIVSDGALAGTVTGSATPGQADHVVYQVSTQMVWVDVFTTATSDGNCFFSARALRDPPASG